MRILGLFVYYSDEQDSPVLIFILNDLVGAHVYTSLTDKSGDIYERTLRDAVLVLP